MSECDRISDLFLSMNDGVIDTETRKRFDEHVNRCPVCRLDFKWYGTTVKALTGLERLSPPVDFRAQLRSRLDSLHSTSYLDFFRDLLVSAPRMPLPVGAVALVCLAVIGFTVYNQAPISMSAISDARFALDTKETWVAKGGKAPAAQPGHSVTDAVGTWNLPLAATDPASSAPSTTLPRYSGIQPSTPLSRAYPTGVPSPTVADRLGADNLTVESASIDQAVESLKNMLPNLDGAILKEDRGPGKEGWVIRVMIPPGAYPNLTTALVNFGALESGAGNGVTPPQILRDKDNNVLLHIRFVNPR